MLRTGFNNHLCDSLQSSCLCGLSLFQMFYLTQRRRERKDIGDQQAIAKGELRKRARANPAPNHHNG